MPFLNGIFTRVRQCVAQAAQGLNNNADLMDADLNDIALGLSGALLRDGTGVPTADTPWNGKGITGLRAPANPGDAIPLGGLPASEVNRSLGFTSYPLQLVTGANGAGDFTANGQFIKLASAYFTASGPRARVDAALSLNHQNAATTTFRAYADLFDVEAIATVGQGLQVFEQLNSTIQLGSLGPIFRATNLTAGHHYIASLWAQRDTANGPTSFSAYVAAENY